MDTLAVEYYVTKEFVQNCADYSVFNHNFKSAATTKSAVAITMLNRKNACSLVHHISTINTVNAYKLRNRCERACCVTSGLYWPEVGFRSGSTRERSEIIRKSTIFVRETIRNEWKTMNIYQMMPQHDKYGRLEVV